jgi:predicted nuclease of predicted toxin-antitoxin system
MRFLFDQNISHRILKYLSTSIEATHVRNVRLINSSDQEIWEYAQKNKYIIVTQDSDFNDIYLLKGFPPKIIWIKSGNLKTSEIAELIHNGYQKIIEFDNNLELGLLEIYKINN